MPYAIDVDTGGTFTDAFLTGEGKVEWVKVDTTPHDLTVGFIESINEMARATGCENVRSLLSETEAIKLSTTIGTNTLIQRSGPKLGLIVSKGHEKIAHGDRGNPLHDILSQDMVLGIGGSIDSAGSVIQPINEEEVRDTVKELLLHGARVIVVSLAGGALNLELERQVKYIVEMDYPKHFLGSVPIVLSTEISIASDDITRTNAAILDAYFHREMSRFLYKAEGELAQSGYSKPLYIVHHWGGVGRVAKTKAISTYGSGPAAALCGAAYLSEQYNIPNVVFIDIGGTSADVGVMTSRKAERQSELEIDGAKIGVSGLKTSSIGAGGGSVCRVQGGQLTVGPESAGALPGPACYGLGGTEPTVTDACVVLGYINPEYFLGGRRKLDTAKAYHAIKEGIAQPLDLDVEQAALNILKQQEASCAQAIRQFLRQMDLEEGNTVMLSVGGAGGIYCNRVAQIIGIGKVHIPPFAAVFSAFGSSTLDITHEYESVLMLTLGIDEGSSGNLADLNGAVENLKTQSRRDMRTEGFLDEQIDYSLELKFQSESGDVITWIDSPYVHFENGHQLEALCESFREIMPTATGEPISVRGIRLKASCALPHQELPAYPLSEREPMAALKGSRAIYGEEGKREVPVYDRQLLRCGNIIAGPAVIESEDTTIVVSDGSKYSVDTFLFGVIEKMS